jgi:hypothetical protein
MDVYSADQSRYLGSVIQVWRAESGGRGPATGEAMATGETALGENPPLDHEEGKSVSPTEHVAERRLGEEMGPFPTIAAGNTGPVEQSASHGYATGREGAGVVLFAVRPGRINLGPLTPALYIPTTAVRSVSMERVVLDVHGDEIPAVWRQKPG